MLRTGALLGAVLYLTVAPPPAHAFTIMSGNDLKESCDANAATSAGAIDVAFCMGFIRGAFEQFWAEQIRIGAIDDVCIPTSVSNQQIIDIVKVYLRDRPAERHRPALLVVRLALGEAFPDCFG